MAEPAPANADPTVAAIVLNWNGARLLEEGLPSLLAQDYPALEVVVADNGSSDDSADVAGRLGARFLPNGANLGFAGGNNAAARRLGAPLLLFVNNDMRFAPDFVSRLVEALRADRRLFAADARQLDWDGHRRVHGANRLRWTASPLAFFPFLRAEQDDGIGRDGRPDRVLWGNGANLLVRRAMFERLGGFHEPLRFDLEDFDLCLRAAMRGWPTVHVPAAVARHRVAASFRGADLGRMRRRSQAHNELLVAVRLLPAWLAAATVLRSFARLVALVLTLRLREAAARGGGVRDALGLLPRALRERREVRASASVGPATLLRRYAR
jgi:N-acetylglucosaminyl-diphospho-decaprenol L-rhamnosyltransferase